MDLAIFSEHGGFLFRWFHYLFGVLWIGLLYYFNFVHVEFMGEADASVKPNVIQKLLPRALFWFRWGAMGTFLTGWIYLGMKGHFGGVELMKSAWGVNILIGAVLGTLMWANVWFVIWPNQQVVMQNSLDTSAGKPANPNAPISAARALVASRTNALFSVPMLFFMAAASHLPIQVSEESNYLGLTAFCLVLLGLIELNALKGKVGPMAKLVGVVHLGLALAVVLYAAVECFL